MNTTSPETPGTIKIGMTREFVDSGAQIWDRDVFARVSALPNVVVSPVSSDAAGIVAQDLAEYDILVVRKTGVPETAFTKPDTIRTRLIARFGVGYDHIAMDACTRNGIAVTISPDGVRRPVAGSIVALVMALSHRLREKDLLIRRGDWPQGRVMLGMGLEGRAFASVGFGNIAREAFRLMRPFGMRYLASDPAPDLAAADDLGVEIVDFDTVLREADFLAVNCPLMPSTKHIINAEALARMKPGAYLINTARGQLVDQQALVAALASNRLAGAGLDVFESEPTGADNPLFAFDQVIAAPHSLCWTDECARLTSECVYNAIAAHLDGRPLPHLVNRSLSDVAQ
ncbi:2-hydroxyacid dehydrogenase [Rhodobium gokarnense]|uniref:D-3-phosphoglycerate dehydrogenase n=1 Tax=Rhodobium gokarnense TaxID=364296 RepID=A0ABT3H7E2_9HYPH|nr:NAD(P)-dependent oxidoreductase [Rhodobium gokarnense]MCW2306308.1 D-3-phosphoglycerate dehydrogenase [Rhodobium gokarnense]